MICVPSGKVEVKGDFHHIEWVAMVSLVQNRRTLKIITTIDMPQWVKDAWERGIRDGDTFTEVVYVELQKKAEEVADEIVAAGFPNAADGKVQFWGECGGERRIQ